PSEERVAANRQTVNELGRSGEIHEKAYQDALAYVRSKQPAYDAFDEAHELAVNDNFEGAMDKVEKALSMEPKEPRFYGLKGDILYAQTRYRQAEQAFSSAIQRDPNYYEYYLGRGLAKVRLGNKDLARRDLERSNDLLPTAIATNELGKLSLNAGNRTQAKTYFQMAMDAPGKPGDEAKTNFVRLDLPENPDKYIAAQVRMANNGTLVGILSNRTNLNVSQIRVAFAASVNGKRVDKVVNVDAIQPGETIQINTGWRLSDSDTLEATQGKVFQAKVK
ncbi:MAG: tetratricopeptide repeat protein, partial [Pseudomonadales bacterium]